jgi:hypothetical protein
MIFLTRPCRRSVAAVATAEAEVAGPQPDFYGNRPSQRRGAGTGNRNPTSLVIYSYKLELLGYEYFMLGPL